MKNLNNLAQIINWENLVKVVEFAKRDYSVGFK